MEMLGGRETKGSVFILVQVSLFIKFIVLRRCKAFLKNKRKKKKILFRFSSLFYFLLPDRELKSCQHLFLFVFLTE